MDKQEEIKLAYLRKKRKCEEKEDDILFQRDHRLRILEEIADRSHYYLKEYVSNQALLFQTFRKLDHMKEEVHEIAKQGQKQIHHEIEELDKAYTYELRKLSDQEALKKERNI